MNATLINQLLPADCGIRIGQVTIREENIVVELECTTTAASCPNCHQTTSSLHGRYIRRLQDRPCLGKPLQWRIKARKFVCRYDQCLQKVFCERLPEFADSHARTTTELTSIHQSIGMALGGEARLAKSLSMSTSPDTILRRVLDTSEQPGPPPRYVGIDDWAIRKGQSYGTILIDLERRCVIDILPGRDGEALKVWLKENPQVKVITRDRWAAYRDAATESAPQAKQVADRFHLLRNVREAVEKLLSRHGGEIKTSAKEVDAANTPAPNPLTPPNDIPVVTEPKRSAKQEQREDQFRRVKELATEGLTCREIARRLGLSLKTVHKYCRLDACPDWQPGRTSRSSLDQFIPDITVWIAAGHRNSADLYRHLKTKGYRGSYDAVRRYLNRRIGSSGRPGRRNGDTQPKPLSPPSARKLSFRITNPKENSRSMQILQRLRTRLPDVNCSLKLAEELMEMIRRRSTTKLKEWIARAKASGDPDLKNLAVNLLQDEKAIEAAMTESWSNGPVEGHVNRLKTIKRQMYGRAGMKLLRARVLNKS
jgi:transposase